MSRAIFASNDFKRLVAALTRFPSVGSFAASELINLTVADGHATATSFGVVMSKMRIRAEGELALVGMDERLVNNFASVCPDNAKVLLLADKEIKLRCKNKEAIIPITKGQHHKLRPLVDVDYFDVTETIAKRLSYLTNIAFSDASRPELCCVMMDNGHAMAINQKAAAMLVCPSNVRVAVPLPLARVMSKGDTLWMGKEETVLKSQGAYHAMPSPVAAQQNFPVKTILGYDKATYTSIATCKGNVLAQAIIECDTVLGQIARTEVTLELNIGEKIELAARSGGARFRTVIAPKSVKEECQLKLPMQEVMSASSFLTDETVLIGRGKHNEVFFKFKDGFVLFPSFKDKK